MLVVTYLTIFQALRAYRSFAQLSKLVRPWFVVYQASRKHQCDYTIEYKMYFNSYVIYLFIYLVKS